MKSELDRRREKEKHSGFIAVDWDGTTVEYHGWEAWNKFGKPIPAMVERIRGWLREGYTVKIMTARLPRSQKRNHKVTCWQTGKTYTRGEMEDAISAHCEKIIGTRLEAINVKCTGMIELWDDRVIQVEPNTGRSLAEVHAAELSALKGAP